MNMWPNISASSSYYGPLRCLPESAGSDITRESPQCRSARIPSWPGTSALSCQQWGRSRWCPRSWWRACSPRPFLVCTGSPVSAKEVGNSHGQGALYRMASEWGDLSKWCRLKQLKWRNIMKHKRKSDEISAVGITIINHPFGNGE